MPSASPRGNGRRSMSTSSPSLASTSAAAAASASTSADDSRSNTPTPSRPSLLSRLSLPLTLRNRNRHVADFHVRPDEPHKNYSAGKHVRGAVVLTIVKPIRITHLVVSLHGYVQVVKDPVAMAKTQSVVPRGGSSLRPQYLGNGLASLFQDEQVLSGEGRLEAGKYEFGFDLVFPDTILPSSIDFERGTISYMVTATLTRPTSIAPTTSCDRKVILVEHVDIGCLAPPRPRTIFLEPISKQKTRRKKSIALEKTPSVIPEPAEVVSESESVARSASNDDSTRDAPPSETRSPVQSDLRSEVSGGSGRSAASVVSRAEFAQLSQVGTTFTSAKQQVVDDKTITATIELVKGGCLPGDTVTVRVTVQHIKLIKSMTGVFVTLFRQGKIDTAPPQHKFDESLGRFGLSRTQKEDPYPKSRLGLAGLSLSSTSSTSVFRKDLDQNTAPLIIDPSTMQASVTVSVKVPDDSFPTIKGVPGDMVSFKYQVEVIVDLGGRMSSQMQSGQTPARFGTFHSSTTEQAGASFGPRRAVNIADTSLLRRGKGVVTVSMETVVGSVDSSKTPKPRAPTMRTIKIAGEDEGDDLRPDIGSPGEVHRDGNSGGSSGFGGPPSSVYNVSTPNDQPYYASPPPLPSPGHQMPLSLPPLHMPSEQPDSPPIPYTEEATPSYVPPPPEVPNQSALTDKERMRQAEMRLLPSQPPAMAGPSSPPRDANAPHVPSAPDEDIYDAEEGPSSARYDAPPPLDSAAGGNEPTAPMLDEAPIAAATDDKQERERQRLLREASAPPEVPNDVDRRSDRTVGRGDTPPNTEPSAPVLDDDDDDADDPYSGYGVGPGPSGSGSSRHTEQLPAYQR